MRFWRKALVDAEQRHLRAVYGILARKEDELRALCKDIDAIEVRDAVYRAITALSDAQAAMRAPVTQPPSSGTSPRT